jgi:hypothetical protein
MSHRRILDAVAAELRRHGLPSAEATRLLQELDDHMADLFTEQGGPMEERLEVNERIESRLGRPEALVAAALANRRQSSVFGRHPILSFVVAPIPLAVLSCVGFLFLSFGSLKLAGCALGERYAIEGRAVRDWPSVLVHVISAVEIGLRFVPPALAAALLCWCANRAAMGWRWTLTAICLVALVAEALVVQVNLPTEPGQGKIVFGLGFPILHWINLVQLLVPISVGAIFLWRARNHRPKAALSGRA